MFRLIRNELLAPADDGGSGAIEDKADNVDSLIDKMGEDDVDDNEVLDLDDDKDDDKEPDDKDDKDDDKEVDDDVDELEDIVEEVDEKKLELDVNLPTRKEILAKYPKLYKDFPALEKSMYREKAFTEIHANPADARESFEKAQALDNFEQSLVQGDAKKLFESLKKSDQNAFNGFVDNIIEHLGEVDEVAQIHVIRNIAKNIIVGMVNESTKSGNEALKHAAAILNMYAFGTADYEPPTRLSKAPVKNVERDEIQTQRQQFEEQRFQSVKTEVFSKIDTVVERTIDKNIDPNNSMSDFVRAAAAKKADELIRKAITSDTRFKTAYNKLWSRVQANGFKPDDVKTLQTAYTNRAKILLPSVLKTVRAEALKGLARKSRESSEDDDVIAAPVKKGPAPSGKSASQQNSGNNGSKKGGIPAGMSIRDFIEAD